MRQVIDFMKSKGVYVLAIIIVLFLFFQAKCSLSKNEILVKEQSKRHDELVTKAEKDIKARVEENIKLKLEIEKYNATVSTATNTITDLTNKIGSIKVKSAADLRAANATVEELLDQHQAKDDIIVAKDKIIFEYKDVIVPTKDGQIVNLNKQLENEKKNYEDEHGLRLDCEGKYKYAIAHPITKSKLFGIGVSAHYNPIDNRISWGIGVNINIL
jgi:hypothetical protein